MVYPATLHALATFKQLLRLLPASEKARPQIILLAGETTPYRNDTDREIVFRQESNFYYLSGCTIPSSFLVLVFRDGTGLAQKPSIELFIPKSELEDIMWSPPNPSLQAAAQTHDVAKVEYPAALPDALNTVLKAFPDAMVHTLPRASPLFPVIPTEFTDIVFSNKDAAISDLFLLPALHQTRLIKDEAEIALIRKANEISSRAHEVVMRVLGKVVKGAIERSKEAGADRPLLPGEWLIEKEAEAEAIFVASCRREGAVHQAYLPIVAASTRASTLHYCCNDREFAWGPVNPRDHHNRNDFAHGEARELNAQVLLIDAGCEWNCYASDITRTMPVGNGGKFTPEARAIYDLVLEMQKLALDMIKPGVHWDAVHLLCHRILVKGFQRLKIFKSPSESSISSTAPAGDGNWDSEHDEEKVLASGISSAFFPHGLGHSLGMDVHDVPSASKPALNSSISNGLAVGHESFYTYLRLRLPLEKNMVVTVEPGCYFSPHLIAPVRDSKHINQDVLKRYESVGGVRIEDVVLITEDGYENLTTVRSDTEWVEGLNKRLHVALSGRAMTILSLVLSILACTSVLWALFSVWMNRIRESNRSRRLELLKVLEQDPKSKLVGFFHPYCNAGGGGERVLWTAIAALQRSEPNTVPVVYTGDIDATKDEIIFKVKARFDITLDPKSLAFVFLSSRKFVEDSTWPRFTLLGQSIGSMYLAGEAMLKLIPDLFIDTMGYAFTFHVVTVLADIPIGAYVHYPTISVNMLNRVKSQKASHNNSGRISSSLLLSQAKLLYYRIFLHYYSSSLRKAAFIMVNSSWTQNHINAALGHSDILLDALHYAFPLTWLLRSKYKSATYASIVYPPCDTREISKFSLNGRDRVVLSLAQFRPEKDHPMQIRALHKLLLDHPQYGDSEHPLKLVMIGGCRNLEDEARVNGLRSLAKDLGVENHVEFLVSAPYSIMLSRLSTASVGLHTMLDEHFGINIVEFMAAGLIPVAHKSGGPLQDIVVPFDGQPTGFHADSVETFAKALHAALSLPASEDLAIRQRARTWAVQRFSEAEFEKGWNASRWKSYLPST
ncbi:hypothetical protein D9757_000670 [Collybiopsis confluens]|uniref:GDP-Man:Man(3)GlcNAc(2)-PP-Dol alpha-1,2-mannosyltransferase n=1 Tax=Collybiopsis confluens TaxID=2823264 RepID=A0A8H5MGE0_9AGAR|nr:hypothetical protein D9757_000670 [Collybiopsis confluens]